MPALLRNLKAAHYTGTLTVLHPTATDVDGVPAFPTPDRLPEVPDPVVVAVPAEAVPVLVEDCGRAGVRALVVITSGGTPEQAARVHDSVRRHGMRIVGPNCLGITQTDPATALGPPRGRRAYPRAVAPGRAPPGPGRVDRRRVRTAWSRPPSRRLPAPPPGCAERSAAAEPDRPRCRNRPWCRRTAVSGGRFELTRPARATVRSRSPAPKAKGCQWRVAPAGR
nr:CoA-binding protein [Embleya scabrispora]